MVTRWQVTSEFYLDQYLTVQAVECAWIWIKLRHTAEYRSASAQAFTERLAEMERILREKHLKRGS